MTAVAGYGQNSWLSNGATLYSSPLTANVGIGTNSVAIKSEIANGGSPYNLYLSGFGPSLYFGGVSGIHPNFGPNQLFAAFLGFATANGHYGVSAGDLIFATQSRQAGNSNAFRFVVPSDDNGTYMLAMSLLKNGNLGIGTGTPQHKLSVNGTIQAKEIIVSTGWADHVFERGYRLAPLPEVARHIRIHRTLPGIPSKVAIADSGVKLGEVHTKLLEKIEELTLHAIEAEERITALEKRLRELGPNERTRSNNHN